MMGGEMKPAILIAERDEILRKNLKWRICGSGFDVIEASDRAGVLRSFHSRNPDLVIIGAHQNNTGDGLGLAKKIREQDRHIPLILVTRKSSEAQVIAALRAGVTDYFTHPFSFDEFMASIHRNLATSPHRVFRPHQTNLPDFSPVQTIIGESEPMLEIKAYLLRAAATDSTVLITGETGTGKELAAELIHRNSPRHKHPFICINCAALPENLLESELFGFERGAFTGAIISKRGKFELANGGTIFLDEIGDMSPYGQAKILRAIERKEVQHLGGKANIPTDVRVIAATNQDPERMVAEGRFRKDLYYRLNVARIHLPSLQDRKEDIVHLIDHCIKDLNHRFGRQVEGLTEEALTSLLRYDWPGNVRELKNLLEATFIHLPSRRIALMDLPKPFQRRLKDVEGLPESERNQLLSALFSTNWNKSKAAEKLRWSRMTLYRKMAKYRIGEGPES
jgi:DNA-binding NtrC family response regulator